MVQWKNTGGLKQKDKKPLVFGEKPIFRNQIIRKREQKEARMRYAWWNTIIASVSNNY